MDEKDKIEGIQRHFNHPPSEKPPKPVLEPKNKPRQKVEHTQPKPNVPGVGSTPAPVTNSQAVSKSSEKVSNEARRSETEAQITNEEIIFKNKQMRERDAFLKTVEREQSVKGLEVKKSLISDADKSSKLQELEIETIYKTSEFESEQRKEREDFDEVIEAYREKGELTVSKYDSGAGRDSGLGKDISKDTYSKNPNERDGR